MELTQKQIESYLYQLFDSDHTIISRDGLKKLVDAKIELDEIKMKSMFKTQY